MAAHVRLFVHEVGIIVLCGFTAMFVSVHSSHSFYKYMY